MRRKVHPTALRRTRRSRSGARVRSRLRPGCPIGLAALLLAGCATPNPDIGALPARKLDECQLTRLEDLNRLDVAIAIDTSTNSADPSGFDIDEDGVIGVFRDSVMTDRGDSVLAAQVAGIKSLFEDERLRDLRLSIVAYSGRIRYNTEASPAAYVSPSVAAVRTELTSDPRQLEAALNRVLARGSWGTVDYAPALRQSLKTLRRGTEGDASEPRRQLVLFMSNTPTTVRPGASVLLYQMNSGNPNGPFVTSDPDLQVAAKEAIRRQIRIDTIGVGSAATVAPPHLLSIVAGATGGSYYAVPDPTRVHCALLAALATPSSPAPAEPR
jgi:hypothetical protein